MEIRPVSRGRVETLYVKGLAKLRDRKRAVFVDPEVQGEIAVAPSIVEPERRGVNRRHRVAEETA